ncbi:MAG: aldo/keto reductase [Kiritimatiellia bacterium]
MRERKNRDRVIVSTKGAHYDMATKASRVTRADIEFDLGESLKNLQTDLIDLYWLHRDDATRPVGEILQTLADQVRAGKIRYFGCSNWTLDRIREAQAFALQHALPGFVGNQMRWSLAVPGPKAGGDPTMVAMDKGLRRFHGESRLAAVPYSSQAGGWFQKRAKAGAPIPGAFATGANERRFRGVVKLSAETGFTITQIVLGNLLSHPFPVIPIVGCHTREQLVDTLAAADIRLNDDQMAALQ